VERSENKQLEYVSYLMIFKLIIFAWTYATLVAMPLSVETHYVISMEEIWNAEMQIRVEGYV
jgi:hypothetical protein